MKHLVFLGILTLSAGEAYADNNGLVFDAEARGYSLQITDMAFGSSGLMLGKPGVRVLMGRITKYGKLIPVEDFMGKLDQSRRLSDQFNEICVEMFGTQDRLDNYQIESVDYSYLPDADGKGTLSALGCLFTQRIFFK